MKKELKRVVAIYIIGCLAGTLFEFLIGWILWCATGRFVWIYPDSPLQTTSWVVIPLWGLAGLIFYAIIKKLDKFFGGKT